jgi:1,4-dihydroxy-2-naphthoyl-CoA hydrolase
MSEIWQQEFTLDSLNSMGSGTLSDLLSIKFTAFDENSIEATMPVNKEHKQPFGILHGGATAALAETIASVASYLSTPGDNPRAVGIELNINHLSRATEGLVKAICKPVKIGRKIHVWNVDIIDQNEQQISVSRLTTMVKNE